MRIRARLIVLLGLAALLAGCDAEGWESFGDSHAYEKNFHYSYALKPGGRVEVENFNGSIEITGWDRDQVEIDGVQYGATPEMRDAVKINIEATDGAVRIRTSRPPEGRGRVGVKYVIKTPRKVDLDRVTSSNGGMKIDDIEGRVRLRTSNGSVRTGRLRGSLEVATSNGTVEIGEIDGSATVHTTNGRVKAEGIRGALEATSSNGSIDAQLSRPEPHRAIRLETTNGHIGLTMESFADNDIHASTTNGGITLKLPASADANLHAHTSHGGIRSEFDVRGQVRSKKDDLQGTMGNGGPQVELTSTNGRIQLLKF